MKAKTKKVNPLRTAQGVNPRKMRSDHQKLERGLVAYIIENMRHNKPDCRRWISFHRAGNSMAVFVFDLDVNPKSYLYRVVIGTALGALFTLEDRGIMDFTSMTESDMAEWVKAGNFPQGYYA